MSELQPPERTLAEIEAEIETLLPYLPQMLRLALDIMEIRERGLYKATHKSLNAYCMDRWGWSRSKMDRMLALGRELPSGTESADSASQRSMDPPTSQREAARRRKAIETTATENPPEPDQKDRGLTPDKTATVAQPSHDAELAKANKKAEMYQSALDAHKKQSDAKIVELTLEIDRILQGPPAPTQAPEPDFMTQLAIALELSLDSTPEQLLAKVKNLMAKAPKRTNGTARPVPPNTRPREVVTMFKKSMK